MKMRTIYRDDDFQLARLTRGRIRYRRMLGAIEQDRAKQNGTEQNGKKEKNRRNDGA